MSMPKRIIIEYEDGSTKGVEFSKLSRQGWLELSKLRLCHPPSVIPEPSKNYILFRWKDGWKEVVGLDRRDVELLRYYTIERTEEVGRMALEVAEEYPVLLLIKRLPKEIKNVLIVGSIGLKMYALEEKTKKREGGKVEHILYDSKDLNSIKEENSSADKWVAEIVDSLKAEFKNRGLTSENFLSTNEVKRVSVYNKISRTLGIRAMEKKEDVYGFMQLMIDSM